MYMKELITNLNTAFGFNPSKRLKLIHGYDSFIEDFSTLPFVLSEELFIDFE